MCDSTLGCDYFSAECNCSEEMEHSLDVALSDCIRKVTLSHFEHGHAHVYS